LRDNKIEARPELLAVLVRATDVLSDLIAGERTGVPPAAGFEAALLSALEAACALPAAPAQSVPPATIAPATVADGPASTYRIQWQPHPGLFRNASEPLMLVRALRRLGDLTVVADLTRLPALEQLDPETAYIGWTIVLRTQAPETPDYRNIRVRH